MDPETRKNIVLAVGGAVAGMLAIEALSYKPGPVYTGLSREYQKGNENLSIGVWAMPEEGYLVRIDSSEYPDFESPTFVAPFAAALYADEIAHNLGFSPVSLWAKNTLEASAARDKERI